MATKQFSSQEISITPGVLPTMFVTSEQSAELLSLFELTQEEMNQVAGGQVPTPLKLRTLPSSSDCACVNCCSAHPL